MSTLDDKRRALRLAISDPGAYTPRGDNYNEHLLDWQVRAVALALEAQPVRHDLTYPRDKQWATTRAECSCGWHGHDWEYRGDAYTEGDQHAGEKFLETLAVP